MLVGKQNPFFSCYSPGFLLYLCYKNISRIDWIGKLFKLI